MTILRLEGEVLVVEGGESRQVFEWQHRIFFTVAAGYELDEERGRYLLHNRESVRGVLRETVGYLEAEHIDFQTDLAVGALLLELNDDQRQYERAVRFRTESESTSERAPALPELVRLLKPYQQEGVERLLSVTHGANFSVPGSGKTTVIYAVFDILQRNGDVEKLLVIGPRSCFLPWEEESVACFGHPLRFARLTGPRPERRRIYYGADSFDVFLCTYQTPANDSAELVQLCKSHRLLVVIDESHNVKRLEGGVWSESLLRIAPYAARRAILSGTPVPNDYTDLWTQITFLWPGQQVLGDRYSYRHRCEDEREVEAIRQAVRPFCFRVRKHELGLPPVRFERRLCDLGQYQANIYRALSVKFISELNLRAPERQELRLWRRAKMIRLLQAASNPALLARHSEEFDIPPLHAEGASIIQLIERYSQYEVPGKIKVAIEVVKQLMVRGEKVIVWTSFVHNIRMLERLLRDIGPFVVYGAIPRDEREDIEFNREQQIRDFKAAEKPTVLLANPAACAESVSLHRACHHAVYLDRTFNCGQYMQSLDRIHRIGLAQTEEVTYHLLIAGGTIDETVDRRLEEKQANMARLLEDELPVGAFETEQYQMAQSEGEEAIDFEETLRDLKARFSNDPELLKRTRRD